MALNSSIAKKLRKKYPKAVAGGKTFRGELTLYINKDYIQRVAAFLRKDSDCSFDYLSDLCGVDKSTLGHRSGFEVVYHLYSLKLNHRVRLKVELPALDLKIKTVTNVWKTADWHEREAYDMFGINFVGHPNLVRILTPDGFEGHPLRKDYPLKGRQPNTLKGIYRKGK